MEKKFLKGRVALITGASRGIGKVLALSLAKEGANVVLLARDYEALQDVSQQVESFGVKSWIFVADVGKEEDVDIVKKKLIQENVEVDILINNAGVGKYGKISDFSVADYEWIMDNNMKSTFIVTKAFVSFMLERRKGNIIFVASTAGLKGLPGEAIYSASKSAQIAFAQSLDGEVRKKGVKVSVVAPNAVKTSFALGSSGRGAEHNPLWERMLDPQDVAEATLFVLRQSEKSRIFFVGLNSMLDNF